MEGIVKQSTDDPPYWFVMLVATAKGNDTQAREAQRALRLLTEGRNG